MFSFQGCWYFHLKAAGISISGLLVVPAQSPQYFYPRVGSISISQLLVFPCQQASLDGREQCGDRPLLQRFRVECCVGKPSSGEPPALPRHRDGEAEDLVGQLGPGQVHPQLEPVAERHDDPRSQIPDDDPFLDVQDHHKVPLNSQST